MPETTDSQRNNGTRSRSRVQSPHSWPSSSNPLQSTCTVQNYKPTPPSCTNPTYADFGAHLIRERERESVRDEKEGGYITLQLRSIRGSRGEGKEVGGRKKKKKKKTRFIRTSARRAARAVTQSESLVRATNTSCAARNCRSCKVDILGPVGWLRIRSRRNKGSATTDKEE